MADNTTAQQDDLTWGQIFKNATQTALGVLIENEREPVSSSTGSASPSTYPQTTENVHPLGLVTPTENTPLGWIKANWLLAVLAAAALLVIFTAARAF